MWTCPINLNIIYDMRDCQVTGEFSSSLANRDTTWLGECNLMEHEESDFVPHNKSVSVTLDAYEIVTLKVTLEI